MPYSHKPRHLMQDYAAQFGDASIAAAYSGRPPYPREVFETLATLAGPSSRRVLELGAGSGDLTFGLAALVDHIDAVEPSAAMLEVARGRSTQNATNIAWIPETAETFEPGPPYSLAVAAESLHWMDWATVLPKAAHHLLTGAFLAIVTERALIDVPWLPQVGQILARFSTNQDYRPYDVVEEVARRALFREVGRVVVVKPFAQSLDQYVEAYHSRNGFSRERMSLEAAAAFDDEIRNLVLAHRRDGLVLGSVRVELVWGIPAPSASAHRPASSA